MGMSKEFAQCPASHQCMVHEFTPDGHWTPTQQLTWLLDTLCSAADTTPTMVWLRFSTSDSIFQLGDNRDSVIQFFRAVATLATYKWCIVLDVARRPDLLQDPTIKRILSSSSITRVGSPGGVLLSKYSRLKNFIMRFQSLPHPSFLHALWSSPLPTFCVPTIACAACASC